MIKSEKDLFTKIINALYPIGTIYMSVNSANPSTYIGGTWEAWGSGRVPVGVDANDTNFDTVEKPGGASTVTLGTGEIPAHTHGQKTLTGTVSIRDNIGRNGNYGSFMNQSGICSVQNISHAMVHCSTAAVQTASVPDKLTITATHTHDSVGGSKAHNNLQPYITCYMWKRTA